MRWTAGGVRRGALSAGARKVQEGAVAFPAVGAAGIIIIFIIHYHYHYYYSLYHCS
eukprot:SAG31_NODE_7792_length_1595_cov_1.037433_1_plen_56_part_00